jgi:hypothetical protein
MKFLFRCAAIFLTLCLPASSGEVGGYPNASTLNGTERMLSDQGGVTVDITPAQLQSYMFPGGVLPITLGGTGSGLASTALSNLLPPQATFGGSCLGTNGTFPSWVSCGSLAANPTALIGVTPINGGLGSYMRSDAAPAIDQSMSPTWRGNHTFIPTSGNAITVTGVTDSTRFFVGSTTIAGCSAGANGVFMIGCDTVPLTHPTASGTYAIKSFVDGTGVPGGAISGMFLYNRSTDTAARNFAISIGNDIEQGVIGITSSTFTGSNFTTGPSGPMFFINLPPLEFCIGEGSSAALCLASNGAETMFAPTSGSTTLTVNSLSGLGTNAGGGVVVNAPNVAGTSAEFNALMSGIDSLAMGVEQATGPYLAVGGQMQFRTGGYTAAANRLLIRQNGDVAIAIPSAGTAFTANGLSNSNTALFVGGANSNQSYGIAVQAGTSATDYSLLLQNHSGSTLLEAFGDGGTVLGSPAGGNKGPGTMNMQGCFVNNIACLTGQPTTGTFTATALGLTTSPTVTAHYTITGTSVTVAIPSLSGTSNSISFGISGLPAGIIPASNWNVPSAGQWFDNGSLGTFAVTAFLGAANSTITYQKANGPNNWTASGFKSSPNIVLVWDID